MIEQLPFDEGVAKGTHLGEADGGPLAPDTSNGPSALKVPTGWRFQDSRVPRREIVELIVGQPSVLDYRDHSLGTQVDAVFASIPQV